ncbi:hypothetical protein B0A54_07244 [Friedmanniomyces endolithicus]|uniref:Uncharacterized protein n=1 Tax=Friedmanniomyces endolithicus TaxID=329885 RepID=A0A4U0V329_9PEZI|nr:hypothetical protein LTS09_007832 [Friedmanniomyces endolithicus]TKA42156.1 hypothetical protein B0A54_07244 [Friedmanniomyces endolithicus]
MSDKTAPESKDKVDADASRSADKEAVNEEVAGTPTKQVPSTESTTPSFKRKEKELLSPDIIRDLAYEPTSPQPSQKAFTKPQTSAPRFPAVYRREILYGEGEWFPPPAPRKKYDFTPHAGDFFMGEADFANAMEGGGKTFRISAEEMQEAREKWVREQREKDKREKVERDERKREMAERDRAEEAEALEIKEAFEGKEAREEKEAPEEVSSGEEVLKNKSYVRKLADGLGMTRQGREAKAKAAVLDHSVEQAKVAKRVEEANPAEGIRKSQKAVVDAYLAQQGRGDLRDQGGARTSAISKQTSAIPGDDVDQGGEHTSEVTAQIAAAKKRYELRLEQAENERVEFYEWNVKQVAAKAKEWYERNVERVRLESIQSYGRKLEEATKEAEAAGYSVGAEAGFVGPGQMLPAVPE